MSETPSEDLNRQQFITQKLLSLGKVTYEEIFERFGNISRQQLKSDALILRKKGVAIESALERRKGIFYSPKSNSSLTYEFREQYCIKAKKSIAEIAKEFVVSAAFTNIDELEKKIGITFQIPESLDRGLFEKKLRNLFSKKLREVFFDSGTTTTHIADQIKNFDPYDPENVSQLQIWTNGRHVFYKLGHPKCAAHTAIIGGRQRYRTTAVSGSIANRFAIEHLPSIDLSLVGISSASMNKLSFYSSNHEDVILKRIIIETKSNFNIVVADSSKFNNEAFGETICSIAENGFIDMIITDNQIDWLDCPIPIAYAFI